MRTDEIIIDDLKQQIVTSNSFSDLCRHYHLPDNGAYRKNLRELVSANNLSISHWNWRKLHRKYPQIQKDCPICHTIFTTQQGHRDEKTVCSVGCSNTYFADKRHTLESNKKISESIKKYNLSMGRQIILHKIKCAICGNEKIVKQKAQRCCSNRCARILSGRDPIYIQKLRAIQMKLIADGKHSGWKSRNILSYPEKFFITVLNNNNIKFIANKPFMSYFLDFAIDDKMIDLEIDGKQHKYPDRKLSDVARDNVLTNNGWQVYRIEWNTINTDSGKRLMKEKIDKFITFYRNIKS